MVFQPVQAILIMIHDCPGFRKQDMGRWSKADPRFPPGIGRQKDEAIRFQALGDLEGKLEVFWGGSPMKVSIPMCYSCELFGLPNQNSSYTQNPFFEHCILNIVIPIFGNQFLVQQRIDCSGQH